MYTTYETSTILVVAGKVLEAINRLPEILAEANIPLPAEYSHTQKGGYLSLYERNPFIKSGELLLLAKLGVILDIDDADFGSKNEKYLKYSGKKCRAFFNSPGVKTSDKTEFGIKGAIVVNDHLIMGFSGKTELEDELLVTVTTFVCKNYFSSANVFNTNGKMISLEEIEENPLVSKEIVNAIARYCTM